MGHRVGNIQANYGHKTLKHQLFQKQINIIVLSNYLKQENKTIKLMNKYLSMFVIKQELKLNTLPHSITHVFIDVFKNTGRWFAVKIRSFPQWASRLLTASLIKYTCSCSFPPIVFLTHAKSRVLTNSLQVYTSKDECGTVLSASLFNST